VSNACFMVHCWSIQSIYSIKIGTTKVIYSPEGRIIEK